MKIWNGYGSEHSANLVMIGKFSTEKQAESFCEIIEKIGAQVSKDFENEVLEHWSSNDPFSKDMEKLLKELGLHSLAPSDAKDFGLISPHMNRSEDGKTITFRTDDVEIGGFLKLMVDQGAKVELFSAHDHSEE